MSETLTSKPLEPPPARASRGLSLAALTAIVVGSMIGSGIFALPSQMAGSAAPGPLLIGWTITGVGMLMLAFVFQTLASRKPDVDGGVYGYARAGFGNYIGFTSAFGYWVSAWVGNVAYLVLLFSTLGYFFPAFEGGATVARDHRRVDSVVDRAWNDPARHPDRRVRQRRGHHRQGGADPHLHRHRRGRIQGRPLHRRLLGPQHSDRRSTIGRHHVPDQEHDAGHRLGVHRHRGCRGLLPARGQAQGRRPGHGASASPVCWPCCCWSTCCPTD